MSCIVEQSHLNEELLFDNFNKTLLTRHLHKELDSIIQSLNKLKEMSR